MATKQAMAYKDKGNEHFKKGEHAKAIEMYTYATELDPNNPIFYTNRSNAYFKMKNWEKSLRDANKSTSKDSSWAKGFYRAGCARIELAKANDDDSQYKAAVEDFKQAVSLAPDNATFQQELTKAKRQMMKGMSQAEILKGEGNDQFKGGKIDEAVATYTKALAACTSTEKDTKIKMDCLANRAACFRQLYRPEECIEDCTAGLAIQPNHEKMLIRRGQALESMEKYKKALADFELVCRLNPNATLAFNSATRIRTAMRKLGMM